MDDRPTDTAHGSLPSESTFSTTWDESKHDHSSHYHHNNIYNNTNYYHQSDDRSRPSKRPHDRLREYVSHGALHNSGDRGLDAPKCFPKTRVAVQQEMISWMKHGRASKATAVATTMTSLNTQQILWLSGPAGSGKTAIMGTIADECHREGLLAASFFFSSHGSSPDRCSKQLFITTLIYQLIQHTCISGLRDKVLEALDRDPLILKKNLEAQVDELILRPLREVAQGSDQGSWPRLFLVDGLDECRGRTPVDAAGTESPLSKDDGYHEILAVLVRASNDASFPFCIIIASRPERAIERYFASFPQGSLKTVFLDSKYSPEADIELYARSVLTRLGLDCGLEEGWFNQVGHSKGLTDVPKHLAKESSGQFVYIGTVMRFIQGDSDPPHKRLEQVLNWRGGETPKPFAALDALYSGILLTSPKPPLAALLICASHHWAVGFLKSKGWLIQAILQSERGQIEHVLGPLSSLIRTVGNGGEPDFHLYHKSFMDFLESPERSGGLHVGHRETWAFLHNRFYDILKNRGPQVPLLGPGSVDKFSAIFSNNLPNVFPLGRKHRYTVEDVDWWLATLNGRTQVAFAYYVVHRKCRWYSCRPACKVWRGRIRGHAESNGWRVPTVLEILQDRFKPFPYWGRDDRGVGIEDILHPLVVL